MNIRLKSLINECTATFACELRLFLRSASTPILIALLLGVCILMLPGSDANYTIISFASAKPIMAASTYLVTAGVVLATLVFPYYLLTLGLGRTRDRDLFVDDLFFNVENKKLPLFIGRTAASLVKVASLSIIFCLFLSLVLSLKLGHTPELEAAAIFLILVISSGFVAVGLAITIEHLFANHRALMLLAVFGLWIGSVVVYIFSGWDVYGFSALESALPEERADSTMAFGIIAGEKLTTFQWSNIPELSDVLAVAKNNLLFTSATILLAFFLVRFLKFKLKPTAIHVEPVSTQKTAELADIGENLSTPNTRFNLLSSLSIELRLILRQHRIFLALAMVVLVASSLISKPAPLAIPASLAGLFLIFRGAHMTPGKTTEALESALAPLQFPNPQILRTLALTLLISVPLTPVLVNLDAGRLTVLLSAIMLSSAWLILTFQKRSNPILGMSVFGLFWYAFGLNTIHPNLDLLAIQSFSLTALLVNSMLLLGVLTALLPKIKHNNFQVLN